MAQVLRAPASLDQDDSARLDPRTLRTGIGMYAHWLDLFLCVAATITRLTAVPVHIAMPNNAYIA